jgi:hypothetical protein
LLTADKEQNGVEKTTRAGLEAQFDARENEKVSL